MKNDLTSMINFGCFIRNSIMACYIGMVILAPIISIIICHVHKDNGERHFKTQKMVGIFLGLFLVISIIGMTSIVPLSTDLYLNIEKKHIINSIFTYSCISVLVTITTLTIIESIIVIPLFFKKVYKPIFDKYDIGAFDFTLMSILFLIRTLVSALGIWALILLKQNQNIDPGITIINNGIISVFTVVISASTITEIYNMYDIIKECLKKGDKNYEK